MPPVNVVLIDKWPRWTRIFFFVLAVMTGLMTLVAVEQREMRGVIVLSLLALFLGSLSTLTLRIELDPERRELVIRKRWLRWQSCRQIPTALIRAVVLRPVGKGSHELGLVLGDEEEVALCQPMGYYDDRLAFANGVARSLGVEVQTNTTSTGRASAAQILAGGMVMTCFAMVLAAITWMLLKVPDDHGLTHPGAAMVAGGILVLLVGSSTFSLRKAWRNRTLRARSPNGEPSARGS